jgi:hypothetical protein
MAGMSAASPFNPRLVVGLIGAGIVAFAAMLLLLAYGGGLGTPRSGGSANVQSVAATGFKGLEQLVRSSSYNVETVRDADDLSSDVLLIVTVEERTTADDYREMLRRRAGRPTLIILPKWFTQPHPQRSGWVNAMGAGLGEFVAARLGLKSRLSVSERSRNMAPRFAEGTGQLSGVRLPVPNAVQSFRDGELVPAAAIPGAGALIAQYPNEPHYILADPDLLNNHGLRSLDNARAAMDLIAALDTNESGVVQFDLTLTGLAAGSAPNALRLAFEPPFLVLTLALFVAALLAGLHGAFRFGPVRREERSIAFGKAALVENSAGLIRLAGRESNLGTAYADVVRSDAARGASAPAWLQGEALDAYLDTLGRGDGPKFSALAAQLDHAQGRHSLMAAARALFQWKKDIMK